MPSEIGGTFAGHAGSNVVLDAMVLAIPIPLYFKKDTAWKQRLGIGLLLLMGLMYVKSPFLTVDLITNSVQR